MEQGDVISRRAVHVAINSQIFDTEYPSELDELERLINEIPALDVAPVVHAKWIKHYIKIGNFDWKYKCSLCGKFNKQYSPPYCPHCGARMDGGKDDENS